MSKTVKRKYNSIEECILSHDEEACIVVGVNGFTIDYSDWDFIPSWSKRRSTLKTGRLTPKRIAKFCIAVAHTGVGGYSATLIQAGWYRVKSGYLDILPCVQKAYEDAYDYFTDMCEIEANRRAFDGYDKPVFHEGSICGYVTQYSDALALAVLKKRRAGFRDKGFEDTDSTGGAVNRGVLVVPGRIMSATDWAERYKNVD